MKKLLYIFLLLSLLTVLAACGGGGGGGSEDKQDLIAINQDNGQEVASAGLSGSSAIQDQGDSTDILGARKKTKANLSATLDVMPKARQVLTKATESETFECDSGTLTLTANDANNNQELDGGDSVSARFDECVITENGQTTLSNGTFSLVVNSISSDEKSMNITAEYKELTVEEGGEISSVDGKMTLDVQVNGDVESVTLSGDRMDFRDGNESGSLIDFTLKSVNNTRTFAWTQSIDAVIQGSEIGGRVIITTPTDFQGVGNNHPDFGEILFTGSEGSYASLNADTGNNSTVLVTIFDGAVTSSDEIDWDELES